MSRIYLSPPHLLGDEARLLAEALESGWIAPLGPQVDAFEREMAERLEVAAAAALSSGTAALHLALRLVGVGSGDRVICPDLTFVATANAIRYLGAEPVFVGVDRASWTISPELLAAELEDRRKRPPKAIVTVDLYGQSADYDALLEIAEAHGLPVVEDAAEALGATYRGRPAGGFGRFGVLSFNGNKIITTSGGGMLLSNDVEAIDRARHLASQAREPAPHYEHRELGYNYRLSNLLAALGRAQLATLEERVARRRKVFARYRELLDGLPGIEWMPEAPWGRSTRWLTCLTLDATAFGADREAVRRALEAEEIEARPVWKPMHLQPLYRDRPARGGHVSADLFARGLCLPSGTDLTDDDLVRIASIVRRSAR